MPEPFSLQPSDRRVLLGLARSSIECAARQDTPLPLPEGMTAALSEPRGCFVTLTMAGQLRGCIGNIHPDLALAAAVVRNAQRAAREDPRFAPVAAEELPEIEIEISVLDEPRTLDFASPEDLLQKLRPYRDGVVLQSGRHRATFLPQVWESLPEPAEFLSRLASKAGLLPQSWRSSTTEIQTYQVTAFTESELNEVGGSQHEHSC